LVSEGRVIIDYLNKGELKWDITKNLLLY
jgi:hypothetical protein